MIFCIYALSLSLYMCILLVLIHLCWFGHADVGPGGHEADVARGLADEQVEEGWPRRHRFDDPGGRPDTCSGGRTDTCSGSRTSRGSG
jgi:hypothetical protein